MKVSELKNYLKQLNQEEIIQLVVDLSKIDKKNAAYLEMQYSHEDVGASLVEEYKPKMHNAFFKGRSFSLQKAKSYISDLRKVAPKSEYLLDLQLYYVECCADFTYEYGDIDDRFYDSMLSVFDEFIRGLNQFGSQEFYDAVRPRIDKILLETENCGWGLSDDLHDFEADIIWHETE